ncbi:hypothetical protein PoB_007155200 [Plakobranchus ocellatus]|uniref:Uncharacterized protein n=1 Tax=Plakobranchus ocellatus TaxID=259542 RepID=A0AAV4DL95_9GAST|nr:hypothetical protein PoB_007155200 [Plakobranchus ocellatus]
MYKLYSTLSSYLGSKVKDYKSSGKEIIVEYVGIPTIKNPGFQILLTVFKNPSRNGQCPTDHFKCPMQGKMCLPASVACDGYANCGTNDSGDEDNCDSYETVTNLMEHYSLVYDIVFVIFLPLVIFISCTTIALLCMRRYIRLKITIQSEPLVRFTSANGGQARVKYSDENALPPPSYDDAMNPSRLAVMASPPAYSSLDDLVKAGKIEIVESEDEFSRRSPRGRKHRRRHRQTRQDGEEFCHDSMSSLDDDHPRARKSPIHVHKHYDDLYEPRQQRDKRVLKSGDCTVHYSDIEDKHHRRDRRNRRKGDKAVKPVCVKRRADDLVCHNQTSETSNSEETSAFLHVEKNKSMDGGLSDSHRGSSSSINYGSSRRSKSPLVAGATTNGTVSALGGHSSHTNIASSPTTSSTVSSSPPSTCLPPPPIYSNINCGEQPPKYHLPPGRDPRLSYKQGKEIVTPQSKLEFMQPPLPSSDGSHDKSNSSILNDTFPVSSSGPFLPKEKPSQTSTVPCEAELPLCSSRPSTPKSSPHVASASDKSSPSPSSCSTNDQDQAVCSETESKPPSHANSYTESNGSLAELAVQAKANVPNIPSPEYSNVHHVKTITI